MNRPPEILVDTGYVTDENGVLTEMVIPSSVTTQNTPSIVTTFASTINWTGSTTDALVKFIAPRLTNRLDLKEYSKLDYIVLGNITIDDTATADSYGMCRGLTQLITARLDNLTTLNCNVGSTGVSRVNCGTFYGCTSLVDLTAPNLATIYSNITGKAGSGTSSLGGAFYGCVSLQTLDLPSMQNIYCEHANNAYGGCFGNCTGLRTVTLGSVGNAVQSIGNYTFSGCTQSGLTITIYTTGGAALSGEPWGATGADIEYEEA